MKRYQRQLSLNEIGIEGQKKLLAASVAIVGCGGLGSIVAPYLAGAGIGHLLLIDGDIPDISNVHRQVFFTGEEKETKAKVLGDKIKQLNPEIEVRVVGERMQKTNIYRILDKIDLVIECTDDIQCKYLVNDFCTLQNIPLVYGAIYKFEGYVSIFKNATSSDVHLRDIFPSPNNDIPNCSEVGVLNTIAGIIGLLQANEAIKFILDIGDSLNGYLLSYNTLENRQLKIKCKKIFSEDLHKLFESSQYVIKGCSVVPEISWEKYKSQPEKYTLISILEKDEHKALDSNVVHVPLSRFSITDLKEGTNILYCKSGMRSSKLVEELILQGVENVFSLNEYSLDEIKDHDN